MHRNTYLLVTLLAVFAALVIGVNFGKKLNPQTNIPSPTPSVSESPYLTPTPSLTVYTDPNCGVSFNYPDRLTKIANASGGAMLVDTANAKNSVVIACQADIPRPALSEEKIEGVLIGSISANLYHNTSAKDGTPIDNLIFTHPTNTLDVLLAGIGPVFQQVISSLRIL